MPISLDFDTLIKILSPILVAIVGAVAKHIIEGKPRLILYLVHATAHPMPPPPASNTTTTESDDKAAATGPPAPVRFVHTHAIVVQNTGKKTAHNVRINHAIFPLSYQLYPAVSHTVTGGSGASAEICIPVLVPSEQVSISYLYFPPLIWDQIVSSVKCDEMLAKVIQTIPTAPPSRAIRWLFWVVLFIGASTVTYGLLKLLPFALQ